MINFFFIPKKWNGNGIPEGKIQWDLCFIEQVCRERERERRLNFLAKFILQYVTARPDKINKIAFVACSWD